MNKVLRRSLSILKWTGIVVLGLIAILLTIRFIGKLYYNRTPDGGINEAMYIDVNGQEQWISIYGEDKDNPVMLFLHGGPGFSTSFVDWPAFRKLAKDYTKKSGVLVGSSDLGVNGNYYLTNYNEEKHINGSYTVTWEFTEYMKPNIVNATFKRIGKSVTKKATNKATNKATKAKKTSPKKTSTYITILLSDCGTLKYGMVNKKCVKYLQKFLQKKGYYKGYKIDGDYLQYTRAAVKQMQKAYKIKVSKSNQGQWDTKTRDYWRKKYNVTSKKKK